MARLADPRVKAQIAKNLRRLIGDRDVGGVAKTLKMPQAQLSGYINAHRGFSIETLLRFAVMLKCSLDDLVYGVDLEYTRAATMHQYPELETDTDLLDVMTGFELIRREHPDEAVSLAAMFRARMLGAVHAQKGAGLNVASSPAAKGTTVRSVASGVKPRRGGRR